MARVFAEIDHKLAEWIGRQHMFFVATAPRGHEGHVNVYDDHIKAARRRRPTCARTAGSA
jgi:hypothetical protein